MTQTPFSLDHQGQSIRGCAYIPEHNAPCPAVLFLHGFTGNRVEAGFLFVRLARSLAQRGVAAVTFDFLGSGESDGQFANMLVSSELADALRVFDWLQGQPFADRDHLGLLGFSLGGLVAACASARLPACRALALLAPTDVANLCRIAGEAPPGQLITLGPHTLHPRFLEDLRQLDPLGDVVRRPRPTLLIHGSADAAVPAAVVEQYAQALRQSHVPLTCQTIPGADHVFGQPAWQARVIEAVGSWASTHLLGRV